MTRTAASSALIAVLAGCAGQRAADAPSASDAGCVVADGGTPAQLRVGVQDAIRAEHAPVPRNSSERLVFGHLYETLVRIDCNGSVASSLAESWSVGSDGRTWTFRLRPDAAFTEGTAVTAPVVIGVWRAQSETARAIDSLFAEVSARSPHELRLVARDTAWRPRVLAAPQFAIARRIARGWPTGTGAYRVGAATAQQIRLLPRTPSRPSLDIFITGSDGRRFLDEGFDALVSGDARTIEYARVLPGYESMPLPWNRTYVLVGTPGDTIATVPPDVRADLAAAAVRGDVRAAEASSWWSACAASAAGAPAASTRAIVYEAGDSIARGLAERIAALAWPATRTPDWLRPFVRVGTVAPTVQPMNAQALNDAMRRDAGLAFIVAIPRAPDCAAAGPAAAHRAAPLVDARDHLIHRNNIGRVVVDGTGALRFGGGR